MCLTAILLGGFLFKHIYMRNGYIKIHRSLKEWYGSKSPARMSLWIHLLLLANHKPKKWLFKGNLYEVKRGQLITSRVNLADITGISQSYVEKILKELKKQGQIKQQTSSRSRLITIVNYDSYQSSNNKEDNKEDDRKTTERQQKDTNNNVKNVIKNNIYSPAITEIVRDLNHILDTSYRPTTSKIRSLIIARLNEGFTVDDFKKVHSIKHRDWKDDVKMRKYLRPSTLYSPKFEDYLNQKKEIRFAAI